MLLIPFLVMQVTMGLILLTVLLIEMYLYIARMFARRPHMA